MIQACMFNRKEYKIVCLGGIPSYLVDIPYHGKKKHSSGINEDFSKPPHEHLFHFAAKAIKKFLLKFPSALINPNFRVDIFKTSSGKFVVNEFENLEAWYSGGLNVIKEKQASDYMRLIWAVKIVECIKNIF